MITNAQPRRGSWSRWKLQILARLGIANPYVARAA